MIDLAHATHIKYAGIIEKFTFRSLSSMIISVSLIRERNDLLLLKEAERNLIPSHLIMSYSLSNVESDFSF